MNYSKIIKGKKAVEASRRFTERAIEKSNGLRYPSRQIQKIGSIIGFWIGVILILIGIIQLFLAKYIWALGAIFAGGLTIISNIISYNKRKSL